MNFERLVAVASSNRQRSVDLAKLFARSVVVSNDIEVKRLSAREELLNHKKKTFAALRETINEQENKDDIIGSLLNSLGLAGLARGLGGGMKKPPTARITPGKVPVKPARPGIPRIGRFNALTNIAFTGIDFMQRKGAGQTNLQAGVGAGGSLLGGLGGFALGAKGGALLGGSIGAAFGGVGAVPGAAIGGLLGGFLGSFGGSMLGGYVADEATGVDAGESEIDRRMEEEEKRTSMLITKTPFSSALDTFNAVLDKLAAFKGGISEGVSTIKSPKISTTTSPESAPPPPVLPPPPTTSSPTTDGNTSDNNKPKVVIIAGNNDYNTQDAVEGIKKMIANITAKGYQAVFVPPSQHAKSPRRDLSIAMQNAAADSGAIIETATYKDASQDPSYPYAHLDSSSVNRIKEKYRGATFIGDSNEELFTGNAAERGKTINQLLYRGRELPRVNPNVSSTPNPQRTQFLALAGLEETVSPTDTQFSAGGSNFIIAAEPNTTIVPIAVGGGRGGFVSGDRATPFEVATKYAQIMSQFTA